jgi:hypothetical protein
VPIKDRRKGLCKSPAPDREVPKAQAMDVEMARQNPAGPLSSAVG